MTFSLAPLLIHSADVSPGARDALRAAFESAPDERDELLEQAALILHRETDLGCCDVRELVGLSTAGCS